VVALRTSESVCPLGVERVPEVRQDQRPLLPVSITRSSPSFGSEETSEMSEPNAGERAAAVVHVSSGVETVGVLRVDLLTPA
jgi:hypothetical protein